MRYHEKVYMTNIECHEIQDATVLLELKTTLASFWIHQTRGIKQAAHNVTSHPPPPLPYLTYCCQNVARLTVDKLFRFKIIFVRDL